MSGSKAVKSIFILAVFTLISKVLGFFREVLIASKFGAGLETDAFFVALTATTLFSSFFISSIRTTLIPILSEIEIKEGKKAKINHTNNFLNLFLLISSLLILLLYFLAPNVIKILAIGFEDQQLYLAKYLMRLGLPMIFITCLINIVRGYLQSEMIFTEEGLSNLPFNIINIFFLVFLSGIFGIKGLMVASVIATFSQFLIQIPNIKKIGFKYQFKIDFKDEYLKKLLYLIPPVLLSVAIDDLNQIIDRSLASTLTEGSISALNYGNRLTNFIFGIFIANLSTVIFPMLSKESNKDNLNGFKKMLRYSFNTIILIAIPASVGMIVLAEPIVRVAFQRGAFNQEATYLTVGAMVFYSVGLVGVALKPLLNRAFYSLQDTKTPMINAAIAVAVNIILNLILIRYMAHRGLALATSISAILTSILLLYSLRKKIGPLGIKGYLICMLKSGISSIIMGVVVYFMYYNLEAIFGGNNIKDLIILMFSAGTGALLYAISIYFMKVEEVEWGINLFKNKFFKKKVG
ncbi:putative peptidoglycan lipid II flippase [Alkalithermobacter thermoalcaliphilus JW-YL-7 = DSM 7308]|uniref:Probable lipid II flippase MurJ n=1 Tax=Alkalithermobacter thermoalcaliphilus JW-YL-7 = DSM 7308 TaxID=1121328 RepID=A0A150FSJ0_CLOPD|nr:integral membrane protein MviN [[Clostridium] paradoxum JW-YL-7 = DSM 7308]SHK70453.1 putative peptidoglycan lipid II flippase [[Clostridium] paradoxum JW-YL-7 = DSM 7308]